MLDLNTELAKCFISSKKENGVTLSPFFPLRKQHDSKKGGEMGGWGGHKQVGSG